ncbi:MAG: hypothetical protein Q8940_18765 [Bacteroidota bacterium]|nr:hypothetical protein [Bacteroidota bacterium]
MAFKVTSLSILVLLLISSASASVNSWEFSPQEPVCGDTISIKGGASPGEKVDVFVTFEKTVPVSSGKFEYILEDVKIPGGLNNRFTVEARGAKKLNVRVKMVIWVTKSSEASGDTATVSQSSVPPGTYMIKIDGDAAEGTSNVDLKITAFQGIKADSNGDFSYSYNTKAVPSGDFEIQVGDITKKVTIQPEANSDSTSHSSSTSLSSVKTGSSSSKETESSLSPNSDSTSDSSSSSLSSAKTESSLSKENKSALLTENKTSRESTASATLEEKNDSKILIPDKDLEEKKNQTHPSEKNTQKSEFFVSLVDKFYLLIGMGAAILILILYSRRK